MTNPFKAFAFLLAMGLMLSPLHAQDEAPATEDTAATEEAAESTEKKADKKKDKKAVKPRTTVGRAIEGLEYVTEARPNPKAKFFIYLFSASWCKYCPPVMKAMVQDYPKMKKKHVEIILMSPDSEDNIKAYVEKYEAEFPAIRYSSSAVQDVPGDPRAEGLPGGMVVNGKGDVLYNGGGGGLSNWEDIIKKKPEKKKGKKAKKGTAKD